MDAPRGVLAGRRKSSNPSPPRSASPLPRAPSRPHVVSAERGKGGRPPHPLAPPVSAVPGGVAPRSGRRPKGAARRGERPAGRRGLRPERGEVESAFFREPRHHEQCVAMGEPHPGRCVGRSTAGLPSPTGVPPVLPGRLRRTAGAVRTAGRCAARTVAGGARRPRPDGEEDDRRAEGYPDAPCRGNRGKTRRALGREFWVGRIPRRES
jgi:hypothetical protein